MKYFGGWGSQRGWRISLTSCIGAPLNAGSRCSLCIILRSWIGATTVLGKCYTSNKWWKSTTPSISSWQRFLMHFLCCNVCMCIDWTWISCLLPLCEENTNANKPHLLIHTILYAILLPVHFSLYKTKSNLGVGLLMVTIWLELCTSYSSSCYHHLHHP